MLGIAVSTKVVETISADEGSAGEEVAEDLGRLIVKVMRLVSKRVEVGVTVTAESTEEEFW